MISVLAALALAAATDPAPAADTPAAEPPAAAAAPAPSKKKTPDPNEKICWYEEPTGSRLQQQVCATRAERDLMAKRGRDALERHDRSAPQGKFSPH